MIGPRQIFDPWMTFKRYYGQKISGSSDQPETRTKTEKNIAAIFYETNANVIVIIEKKTVKCVLYYASEFSILNALK